jgi:Peptidase family M23
MELMRGLSLFMALLLLPSSSGDPEDYPKNYFRSPLGIPLSLSGNFAEMRDNHFHAGLDIRTNAQTGFRIYAAAEGWISRISVQGGGYGHALYLQHPNGYTTVYGHLERFEEPLASYVKEMQYSRKSFGVNLFPAAGQFRFAKGEVIAYSGNSGSSGGPHLHFEIRDSGTSEPLNPLLFGLPVEDQTRPRIFRIKVYASGPTAGAAIVSGRGDTLSVARPGRPASIGATEVSPGVYRLDSDAHVVAEGQVAFGIQAHDYHDGSQSRLGLYSISLRAGEQEIYRSTMERLNFSTQRYINAHLDYSERRNNRRWVQRSHLLPGNRLNYYQTERRGFMDIRQGDELPMLYSLSDAHGNTTSLAFSVTGADMKAPAPPVREGFYITRARAESFVMPGVIVRVPRGSLYEDIELSYSVSAPPSGVFSQSHNIHRASTPIHSAITVSLKADQLPVRLRPKALLARVSGGRLISSGGSYENGYVTGQTRAFGTYVLAADTVAPIVNPSNISDGDDLSRASSIRIRMSDELSGIATYSGQVDGEWVLFQYDPKRSLVYYNFDDRVGPGRHEFTFRAEDGRGNVKRYKAGFTR